MYSQNGEVNGVKWYSKYLGGRKFKLMVSDLVEHYECNHEPVFGVDASDYANMNEIMDKIQKKIEEEGLLIDNSLIEKELLKEEERKSTMRKADLEKINDENEAKYQEWLLIRDENTPLNSFTEFIFGKKSFEEAVEETSRSYK